MTILGFVLLAALLGLVCYLITTFVPMDAKIKQLIVIAVVVVLVVALLQALGILAIVDRPIPRVALP